MTLKNDFLCLRSDRKNAMPSIKNDFDIPFCFELCSQPLLASLSICGSISTFMAGSFLFINYAW